MPVWEHIEPHLPSVYRFVLRLTQDPHRAEDLTQETFLRAWKNRQQLRDNRAVRVWLFRIAHNLWNDELRRGSRQPPMEHRVEQIVDIKADSPEADTDLNEEFQKVLTIIESLPPRQREVMHLSSVEGLSVAEISDVLDLNRNAVKVNL
ncbi:MAG TPA: RNA polymerase sigma factor, partial [Planctomycetaceae bacterium]|nr:RNA polymerase sigma factor [Planctomycetaceae bacterium]